MIKAIGYLRVSTSDQAKDGVSLDAQRARIEAWALGSDADLLAIHTDEGISGYKMANRPGLLAALDDACGKKAALVVHSLSRLARNTREALELSDRLAKSGADLVSLSERLDTTSAAGRMTFRLLAVLNEFERDLISERTRNAMQFARSQGKRVGNIPYGFNEVEGKLFKNEFEQDNIMLMRQLRRHGLSLRKVAVELEHRGILTKMGNEKWHPYVIQEIIRSAEEWETTTGLTS